MYTVKHHEDHAVEVELMASDDEVLDAFYAYWADNGYNETIYVPDDITQEDIPLDAAEYFDSRLLQKLEIFIDEYGSTDILIKAFHTKLLREL